MLRAALLVAVGVVLAVVLLWQADRLIRRMSIDSEPIVVPSSTPDAADGVPEEELELEIVTLLPFDAIPAISNPTLITADEADSVLDPGRAGDGHLHQRRAESLLRPAAQPPRDRERHRGRRAAGGNVVTPLLFGHRVWPGGRRRGAYLRGVGQADHELPCNVRPGDRDAVEPVLGQSGGGPFGRRRAAGNPRYSDHVVGVERAAPRHDGAEEASQEPGPVRRLLQQQRRRRTGRVVRR